MTLRAEDFNLKETTASQNKAEEYVKLMNQGVEEKNYPLYKDGFKKLMNEVRADMPQLNSQMNYTLFLFDMVSRFINEVQEIELGFTEKPFETRVGIGQLFLNPTLEVRSTETGDVVAIFDSVNCFRMAKFNWTKLEAIQDKRIANQDRRKLLMEQIECANELKEAKAKWIFKGTYAFLMRFKKSEHCVTEMQKELAEVQVELEASPMEFMEMDRLKQEFEMYQDIFKLLMSQYQVPDFNTYLEQLEKKVQLQQAN